ncbi:hypothetical protein HHK36_002910 [Tetracentron sinense]|uniref:RRM domain-containing protein n=1 Tax=Tetracentron sinense TaxID=13715 RepID=A0A834ZQ99_TETSI|nr:hypothetical protein HHK36_002910 [Tetracentron sinense]
MVLVGCRVFLQHLGFWFARLFDSIKPSMDFDEYDYLEKTVEDPERQKEKETRDETVKSGEKDRSRRSKHRSDENEDDFDRVSKRARSGDENRDHDRVTERGSSRHRSSPNHRSRDGERSERDRHKSSREHREKDRDRDRDKDRDRDREERNGKEKDRDRYRERERDRIREPGRESEQERERERSRRSRSRSERHHSDRDRDAERQKDREKSRDREIREREREMERELRDRDRESRRVSPFGLRAMSDLLLVILATEPGSGTQVMGLKKFLPKLSGIYFRSLHCKNGVVEVGEMLVRKLWALLHKSTSSSDACGENQCSVGSCFKLTRDAINESAFLVKVGSHPSLPGIDVSTCLNGNFILQECIPRTWPLYRLEKEFAAILELHKEKKEEVVEPEADPERDQRTVFAYQISLKADERDVYDFFSRAGKVRDVRLIMDRNSRRSKGVGYIEFYDAMSVPMAIALSGQMLLGQPVMVKPSEAEKNLVQSNTAVVGAGGLIGPYSGGARRLYVGNLHFNITEDQLRQVFEPFGPVELVQLPLEPETGQCKGFGFVQFARLEDARAAQSLNGQLDIAGRIIKVSAVSDQVGMQDIGANAGDFDDDDGGGLSLNARSRAILMQKLDRSGNTSSIAGSVGTPISNSPGLTLPAAPILGAVPVVAPVISPLAQASVAALAGLPGAGLSVPAVNVPPIDTVGVPSECLLLKNMFDPKMETEPDFDLDIKEDVQDECSKFGTVEHIYVDKNSSGHVYLRFENAQPAISAQRALHGRWFAGKMITATFMLPQNYEAKFPDSRLAA